MNHSETSPLSPEQLKELLSYASQKITSKQKLNFLNKLATEAFSSLTDEEAITIDLTDFFIATFVIEPNDPVKTAEALAACELRTLIPALNDASEGSTFLERILKNGEAQATVLAPATHPDNSPQVKTVYLGIDKNRFYQAGLQIHQAVRRGNFSQQSFLNSLQQIADSFYEYFDSPYLKEIDDDTGSDELPPELQALEDADQRDRHNRDW